jgi:hypothetical protein
MKCCGIQSPESIFGVFFFLTKENCGYLCVYVCIHVCVCVFVCLVLLKLGMNCVMLRQVGVRLATYDLE